MRKNIDLPEEVIEAITIEAAKNKTVFKPFAEKILSDYSKPLIALQKQKKSGGKKK
jgi:hypothetical protein